MNVMECAISERMGYLQRYKVSTACLSGISSQTQNARTVSTHEAPLLVCF